MTSCTQVAGWFDSDKDSTQASMVDSSTYAAFAVDESITEANAYSDLFLDSASLESFIKKENIPDSSAHMMRAFYRVRNYQYAWFTTQGLTEQGKGVWSLRADSATADKDLRKTMDTLAQHDSLMITRGDSTFLNTELGMTRELMHFAAGNGQGWINRENVFYLVPTKKVDAMELADSVLNKQKDSSLYAGNPVYTALKQQLALYYKAAKDSSGMALPATGLNTLRKGTSSPAVAALKKRLQLTGDYASGDTTAVYSDSLMTAIRTYQLRNGLAPTGMVNDSLVQHLNVPAAQRVEQILVNMNRAMWMAPPTDSFRIMVNIPSFMLHAYGDSSFSMPVVVGKEGNSTVMFSGEINQVVFSPTWNVPRSIVENEIMAKMKADPNYLKKNNMVMTKGNDSVPTIKQLPGKDNAMGRVKFLFPNSFEIFLHDTPDKTLFTQSNRALSHGCIRVADPQKLARYILRDQQDWTAEKINAAMNSGKEQFVQVKNKIPVYITYYTAWVDDSGKMAFRDDVYGHDTETRERMFRRS